MNLDKDDRGAATVLRPKSEKLLRKPIREMPEVRCRVFHQHMLAMNLTKMQYRKLGIFAARGFTGLCRRIEHQAPGVLHFFQTCNLTALHSSSNGLGFFPNLPNGP